MLRLLRMFRDVLTRRKLERELREELRFHHSMLAREYLQDGHSDDAAAVAASRRLGNTTTIREDARSFWSIAWLESARRDVAFAFRSYRRTPGFTAVVLTTLALGIGATTAVYSAVDGILLRPLPYPDSERLVAPWPSHFVSPAEFEFLQKNTSSYGRNLAMFSPGWSVVMTQSDKASHIAGARASGNFFDVLGVRPHIGRLFIEADGTPGSAPVVLISWSLWHSHFDADSSVVGTTALLDGTATQIIGVMPAGFSIFQANAELWMPIRIDPASPFFRSATAFLTGRLREDVSIAMARTELQQLAARMRETFAFDSTYGSDIDVRSLHENIVGDVSTTLIVLFAATTLLVLIACANVANLLVARGTTRRAEMAVRRALGADRSRILRQLFIEALLLALAGGTIGVAVGAFGLRGIVKLLPSDLPRLDAVTMDLRVLAMIAVSTVLAGLFFGLWPALEAGREQPQRGLRTSRATGRRGVRHALVITEMALALVLMVGAALAIETMWNLTRVDPGFDPNNVLSLRVQASGQSIRSADVRSAYLSKLYESVGQVPGVMHVGSIQHLPLSGFGWSIDTEVEGRVKPLGAPPFQPGFRIVGGDYFKAMGIPLLDGRLFTREDDASRPGVVIVNSEFARMQFPGEEAVGKRIMGERLGTLTIVGVVGDVRHAALSGAVMPELFVPVLQMSVPMVQLVVKTSVDPMSVSRAIVDQITAIDRFVPVSGIQPLTRHTSASVTQPRAVMTLMFIFAAIGLVLGIVGMYGVVSYTVAARTREIGIRMALGAGRREVVATLLRTGVVDAAAGAAIGVTVALMVTRWMESMLFGVSARNVATYVAVTLLLLASALAANWIPARRASRADPMHALRAEVS